MFLAKDDWINVLSLALHQVSQDTSFECPQLFLQCVPMAKSKQKTLGDIFYLNSLHIKEGLVSQP